MEKYLDELARLPLFADMKPGEIAAALDGIGAYRRSFGPGELVLMAGERPEAVGLLLSGGAQVYRQEADGRRNILAELGAGELFAEALVGAGVKESPVTVETVRAGVILFMPFGRHWADHGPLLYNLLTVVSWKNVFLTDKISLLTRGTIRERLLTYFYWLGGGESTLTLPFGREELADYIGANRSAVSRELGKMGREGLISLDGRRVTVHRWS